MLSILPKMKVQNCPLVSVHNTVIIKTLAKHVPVENMSVESGGYKTLSVARKFPGVNLTFVPLKNKSS